MFATIIYMKPPEDLSTDRALTLYEKQLDYEDKIIKRLVQQGANLIVDSIHFSDDQWFSQFEKGFVKCYGSDGSYRDFGNPKKRFVVFFDSEKKPSSLKWDYISYVIRGLRKVPQYLKLREVKVEAPPLPESTDLVKVTQATKEQWDAYKKVLKEPESYRLNLGKELEKSHDIMLFEMFRPNEETPYTLVVKNYSKVGRLPFFTGYFVCKGFGGDTKEGEDDRKFLKYMWDQWGMKGEFDLDLLRLEAVENCYPKIEDGVAILPNSEPVVIRQTKEAVTRSLLNKLA